MREPTIKGQDGIIKPMSQGTKADLLAVFVHAHCYKGDPAFIRTYARILINEKIRKTAQ